MLTSRMPNKQSVSGNRAVGSLGEAHAARFLRAAGYEIIGRNVRTYLGEIDIVARKHKRLFFVEVKTRRGEYYGPPYNLITRKKKRKLVQCAFTYCGMKGIDGALWQIDVISVELHGAQGNVKKIGHFENAIEE